MDITKQEEETTIELVKSLVGKEVSCTLYYRFIKKGKIIKEGDKYYILQNVEDGNSAKNKQNYNYSWEIDKNNCDRLINLKPLTQSIELWI